MSAGDTNKFLREDCHLALDAMVENLSPARVIAVITTDDFLNHKNPTVRYCEVVTTYHLLLTTFNKFSRL